jgi:hypothetical protein
MTKRVSIVAAVVVVVVSGLSVLTLRAADEKKSDNSSSTAAQPASAHSGKDRFFEMRTYRAAEGKMDALHARFRDHTNALFKKHGIEVVGYWQPVDQKDTLVYIVVYPSREAREAAWKAFGSDPEWKKALAESEKNGKLTSKVESVYMTPTDYSPMK